MFYELGPKRFSIRSTNSRSAKLPSSLLAPEKNGTGTVGEEVKNDAEVQKAAQNLFEGVAPERRAELTGLWKRYTPRFNLLTDAGPDGLFVLDAGLFREVRFNHRAMRAFWLAAFIAWEGYERIHELVTTDAANFERFNKMLEAFFDMLKAKDPAAVNLPEGVPEPGIYPDAVEHPFNRAAAELATFATGWALLHEIRHLQHQQEETGAKTDAPAEDKHREELSRDEYATAFVFEQVGEYARTHSANADQLCRKRQLGIYFAMFAMTLIGAGHWDQSDSHPAMQARIDAAILQMGSTGTAMPDAVAHAAFVALWTRWPDAPGPFKRLTTHQKICRTEEF